MTTLTLPRKGLKTLVDGLITSPLPANAKNIFSTFTPTSAAAWNTSCWAAGYNFSGVGWSWYDPAADPDNYERMGGALITRRHLIFAYHFIDPDWDILNAMSVRLVDSDGTWHVIGVDDYVSDLPSDLAIVQLESDAPAKCAVYPVLSVEASSMLHLETLFDSDDRYGLITTDQEEKAIIHDHTYLQAGTPRSVRFAESADATRALYYEEAADGDSGHPIFLPLPDGNMALLTTFLGKTSGPFYTDCIEEINAAIDSFDGTSGYELDVIDIKWEAGARTISNTPGFAFALH